MQAQSNGSSDWSHIDPAWGNWLAGFIDGEGCFQISRTSTGHGYKCVFDIGLRQDDRPILVEIQERLGIGYLLDRPPNSSVAKANPSSTWGVWSRADIFKLVQFLDKYPLRAKKAQDFAIWRQAVLELTKRGPMPGRSGRTKLDWSRIAELRQELVEGRKYRTSGIAPSRPAAPTFLQIGMLEQVGDE